MAKEDWRLCVEWLVRCQALPADHKLAQDASQVFDLAQFIRDGVLICHLLNRLHPGSVDPKDFSQRPQMSQFLCLKNIRTFLTTCRNVFQMGVDELFEPTDLFDVKDFGKVINALSVLSCTREAQKTNIPGFTTRSRMDYHPLHTLAVNTPEDNIYDVKYPDDDHEIYEDLCSLRKRTSIKDAVPVTKRDFCIKELVETEKNYIDALNMIIECFIKRLGNRISEADSSMIFMGIENLYHIHQGFHADLIKACSQRLNSSYTGIGNLTIADCFIKWKEKFLAYGEFCSNLPKVQMALDKLMQNQAIQQHIMECQKDANGGKFRLRDLLSVPMQRVLKYHLLLKELIKNTDQMHPDRKSLERALDEMQDLSGYVNEVKRDNETLQLIEEIETSIVDVVMSENARFRDYGRLLKDGELRVRRGNEKKDRSLSIFLFDKAMVICKSRRVDKLLWGETYNYKDGLILSHHILEEVLAKEKDRYPFLLVHKDSRDTWTFTAKTQELRAKWIEAINLAHDNLCPPYSSANSHEFMMASFKEPTICDVCRKLLRGIFFQGYKCQRTNMVVHKACIEKAKDIGGPPSLPPKMDRSVSSTQVSTLTRVSRGKLKANTSYHGIPVPSIGQPLIFEENDVFQLISDEDNFWWQGQRQGVEGYFPKSFVIVLKTNKQHSTSSFNHSHTSLSHGQISSLQTQLPLSPESAAPSPLSLSSASSASLNGCSSLSPAATMNDYQWFVGECNREEASRMLEKLPDGTFLVRVSNTGDRKGEYALSIKYGSTNPVKHIKLHRNAEGMYYLVDCKMFRGLPELVQYYQQNSLARSFPEVPSVLQLAYKEALLPSPGASGLNVVGYCIAQNDYSPMETNQIALRAGDRIAILDKSSDNRGWWKGRLNGKVGYFPSEYVSEI